MRPNKVGGPVDRLRNEDRQDACETTDPPLMNRLGSFVAFSGSRAGTARTGERSSGRERSGQQDHRGNLRNHRDGDGRTKSG